MKIHKPLTNQKGFSLLFIVLVFSALVLITVGAATLVVKLQSAGDKHNTIKRMEVIRDALKKYYRGHQDLPAPVTIGTTSNLVPVGDLNLEQKYRMDASGQFFYYYTLPVSVCTGTTTAFSTVGRTALYGMQVDTSPPVAAVIISNGPDQYQDIIPSAGSATTIANTVSISNPMVESVPPSTGQSTTATTTVSPTSITSGNDDIIVQVNLQAEATEIALNELRSLEKRRCLTLNCGTKSNPTYYDHYTVNIDNLINEFSLGCNYFLDPWLNTYDANLNRVFSYGPDGTSGSTDDIRVPCLSKCCQTITMPVTDGLKGYFPMEGNDGTPHGDPEQVQGKVGEATEFDGDDDYYDYGNNSDFDIKTGNATLTAWIKIEDGVEQPDTWTDSGGIVHHIGTIAGKGCLFPVIGYGLYVNNGKVQFQIRYPAGVVYIAESNNKLNDGKWHHLAGVLERGKTDGVRLYVDGALQTVVEDTTSLDSSMDISNNHHFTIGSRGSGGVGFNFDFKGIIDEVAFFNTDLDICDIQQIYNVPCNVGCEAEAYYPFDGTAADRSGPYKHGHGHNGINHDAVPADDRFGCDYKAYEFDGNDYIDCAKTASLNPETVSVAAWVKATAPGSYKYILSKPGPIPGGAASYALYTGSGSASYFYVTTTDGTYHLSPNGGNIWDGSWHYIVGTYDKTHVRIYIDGIEAGTGTPEADDIDYSDTGNFVIGAFDKDNPSYRFPGTIDEVALFSKALDADTILDHYERTKP